MHSLWLSWEIPFARVILRLNFTGLNLKDCSETNVDNTGSNIRHSLKNVLFEDHVSVKTIREKNMDNGEFRFQLTASQKDNYGPGLKKK